jgi:hypothetical protein
MLIEVRPGASADTNSSPSNYPCARVYLQASLPQPNIAKIYDAEPPILPLK